MSFRDDREASHLRAEALEKRLQETERELATLREGRPKPSRNPQIAVALGLVTACMGIAGFVLFASSQQRSEESSREAAALLAERESHRARVASEAARAAAEAARALEEAQTVARAEVVAHAQAVPEAPPVTVRWPATVNEAVGVSVAAGARCVLEGTFVGDGPATAVRALRLRCGESTLYDGAPARASLRAGPVFGSTAHEYQLSVHEGPLQVSTLNHRATLTLGEPTPGRVSLFVRDVSEPVEGSSPSARFVRQQPLFAGVIEREARVSSVTGNPPVRLGDRCDFAVRPVWENTWGCRIAVRCGAAWLYGAGEMGYLSCALRGGAPAEALDENPSGEGGDPRLTWRADRVVVSDFTAAGAWSATLTLRRAAR